MKKYFSSYWLWFYILFTIVSIADYIDHISRPGQDFELDKSGCFFYVVKLNHFTSHNSGSKLLAELGI